MKKFCILSKELNSCQRIEKQTLLAVDYAAIKKLLSNIFKEKTMKRLLTICLVLGMVLPAASVLAGPTYTFTQAEIDSLYQVTTGTAEGTLDSGPDALGDWTATISGSGFGDLQIGRDATDEGPGSAFYSGSWADLSGYDAFSLVITNTSTTNDWFMANLYINTGYTDWGETDKYYENTWTWLAPDQSVTLILDLTGIALSELQHISSIGFNIGTNIGDGDYFGDSLSGSTQPIPAPGAILLGGIGVCLVGWLRRRRSI